jgi:hypothetical protein
MLSKFRHRLLLLFWLFIGVGLLQPLCAQPYAGDDLKLYSLKGFFHHNIGNVGKLETVVDLRGFVPVSGNTLGYGDNLQMALAYGTNYLFKVPTKQGIGVIFYGADMPYRNEGYLWSNNLASVNWTSMPDMKFISEKEVQGEYKQWADLAYNISGEGVSLFQSLDGGDGYKSAEPVAVVFTSDSAFVLITFRYTHVRPFAPGSPFEGQYIVALEFSRHLKKYRAPYDVYDTFLVNRELRKALESSGPLILKVLSLTFKD